MQHLQVSKLCESKLPRLVLLVKFVCSKGNAVVGIVVVVLVLLLVVVVVVIIVVVVVVVAVVLHTTSR